MLSRIRKGSHASVRDCEESSSEDKATAQGDIVACEQVETAAHYLAFVLDVEIVILANSPNAGQESGKKEVEIDDKALDGFDMPGR